VVAEGPLAAALAALAPSERQPHAESLVLRVVRELTGGEAVVAAGTPLMEAGVDSLAATELSNRLRAATGLTLSPTLVFEQPTPRAIAAHVLEQACPSTAASTLCTAFARALDGGAVALVDVIGSWPGGCAGEVAQWAVHTACGDAMGGVPLRRWVLEECVDTSALSSVQAACVRHGGFVACADGFDAVAFGISPAEAGAMDPQQRLLLELGYAALHGSSQRRVTLMGGDGGVFLGI
jgi:acyl carrier protein